MGPDVVVPSSKAAEVFRVNGTIRPQSQSRLQRSEKPLDPTVLPRSLRQSSLMLGAEHRENEGEERRPDHRSVLGSESSGAAESLDEVDDRFQDREGGLVRKLPELEAGSRPMVNHAHNRLFTHRRQIVQSVEGEGGLPAALVGHWRRETTTLG